MLGYNSELKFLDAVAPSTRAKFAQWAERNADIVARQVISPIGAEGLDRRGPVGSCRLFLGPGFRLAARWNRLGETVKTRKKRGKTGKK